MSYVNQHLGYNTSSGWNDVAGLTQYKNYDDKMKIENDFSNKLNIKKTLKDMNDEYDEEYSPQFTNLKLVEKKDEDDDVKLKASEFIEEDASNIEEKNIYSGGYSVQSQKINKEFDREQPGKKRKKGKRIPYEDTISKY
jgi:hypothetical protein